MEKPFSINSGLGFQEQDTNHYVTVSVSQNVC